MSDVKNKLLEILSPEELEKEVEKKLGEGARSEHSALNKILRENSEQTVMVSDHEGYFVTSYVRSRDEQQQVVIATDGGISRIATDLDVSSLDTWQPVKFMAVAKKRNISTGSIWFEGTEDTVFETLDSINIPLSSIFQSPSHITEGGMYLVKGRIQYVNEIVTEFDENNQPLGYKPIVDGGVVNLKLVVTDEDNVCTVSLKRVEDLQNLIGKDISWVNSEDGFVELKDSLTNIEIVMFGGGDNRVNGNTVTPFMQLREFGFIKPWG